MDLVDAGRLRHHMDYRELGCDQQYLFVIAHCFNSSLDNSFCWPNSQNYKKISDIKKYFND